MTQTWGVGRAKRGRGPWHADEHGLSEPARTVEDAHAPTDWQAVLDVLDVLQDGLRICDMDGTVRRENGRMMELLAAEPERSRVEEEIEIVARSLNLLRRNQEERGTYLLERTIRTDLTEYRLYGVTFSEGCSTGQPVLLILQPCTPTPPTDEELRSRSRMTEREIRIARMLAQGKSNGDIARDLRISIHTARHHVEHVLGKLGVRTRAQVGPALSGLGHTGTKSRG